EGDAGPSLGGSQCSRRREARAVIPMREEPDLTGEEREELERLRAEVGALRSQLRRAGRDAEGRAAAGRVARQRWRAVVATLLIVVACVLAPLSVVAVWARNQVTNTDRYVRTVTPLANDPSIQNAIAD